jgi:hypothetical protein
MESFFQNLYTKKPNERGQEIKDAWLEIQKLAFEDDAKSNERIQALVLKVQRWSVRLPIVRKASQSTTIQAHNPETDKPEQITLAKGTIVVCDIVSR